MNKTVSFLEELTASRGRQISKPAVCYVSSLEIQSLHLDVCVYKTFHTHVLHVYT